MAWSLPGDYDAWRTRAPEDIETPRDPGACGCCGCEVHPEADYCDPCAFVTHESCARCVAEREAVAVGHLEAA
jgi:hypothetical protein